MASPETIDIARVLAPIDAENPSGEELSRSSPSFDKVKTCYGESKESEKQIRKLAMFGSEEGEPEPDAPVWKQLVDAAVELLATESKDLRIAAWMAEALIRLHGFAGLRDGLKVCQGLCSEQFWPTIHPQPDDEDGHEMTVAQLAGLCGEASFAALSEIEVTRFGDERYTMGDYADAVELARLDASAREKRVQEGAVSYDQIQHAVLNTPANFYFDLIEDIDQSVEALDAISDFLDADDHCLPTQYGEPTAPAVTPLKDRLQEIRHDIAALARTHLDTQNTEEVQEGELVSDEGAGTAVAVSGQAAAPQRTRMSDGQLETREEAFRALEKIADFFERTEPHSPLSHAIRQAITWGQMSYQDLLKDIVRDRSSLDEIFLRVGVPRSED